MVPSPVAPTAAPVAAFASGLAAYGDGPALITTEETISYRDLAARVEAATRRLGDGRRLIVLVAQNTVESVVYYLAALAGRHAVLLVPGDKSGTVEASVAEYDPDVVVASDGGRWTVHERRPGSGHEFHPDLALLLSTSGSTASAKLVRLSHENLTANAESIATYLAIGRHDRAATTLPMSYCYGLSVINSHLLRGASLILTDHSVADAEFWQLFRAHRGTSFAGVPYTFDLLERVGFASMHLPDLRYVTQAGGRLAPDRVRQIAELGRARGWDLFVMYGQTEATARMSYLPPHLAVEHPQSIGVPIPGGSFRLEPLPDWPDADTGELVYTGPNVMLGYAQDRSELRLGRLEHELRTGDIARRTPEGVYEIVGRRSRFIKLFGLRIDLQRVEESLARRGLVAVCVGDDSELVIALADDRTAAVRPTGGRHRADLLAGRAEAVQHGVTREYGLPPSVVRVVALRDIPRLPNGKPDYPAVRAMVAASGGGQATGDGSAGGASSDDLVALYAEVLGAREVTADSTFVSLGGDSLSYVEMSIRLERALGNLPKDWHTTPIRDLGRAGADRSRWRSLDTSVLLRAAAILLVVGHHVTIHDITGGAHILLGVAGYNFARFHLSKAERGDRTRGLATSISRVAIASMLWIGFAVVYSAVYAVPDMFLLNYVLGPATDSVDFNFWFIETLVYILLVLMAVTAIPAVDRMERRFPFAVPLVLLSVGIVARYAMPADPSDPSYRFTPVTHFWLFALGWLMARATTTTQKLLLTAAIPFVLAGWFDELQPEILIAACLILLLWIPTVPSVGAINRVAGLLAANSLYIYLTHFDVFPRFLDVYPPDRPLALLLATVGALAVGIMYGEIFGRVVAWLTARLRRLVVPGASRDARPRHVAGRTGPPAQVIQGHDSRSG